MSDRIRYHYSIWGADDAGFAGRHPQGVITGLFPDATNFESSSVGDCWFFTAERRDDLPPYITPCGTDGIPMWGWHGNKAPVEKPS